MAVRKSPSKGGKADKLMRDALMLALNREATNGGKKTKKLTIIAEKLVDLAVAGDIQAIKEVSDRVDGKPTQQIGSDPEHPFGIYLLTANAELNTKLDRLMRRE